VFSRVVFVCINYLLLLLLYIGLYIYAFIPILNRVEQCIWLNSMPICVFSQELVIEYRGIN